MLLEVLADMFAITGLKYQMELEETNDETGRVTVHGQLVIVKVVGCEDVSLGSLIDRCCRCLDQ